jgi:hypothetical protein
MCGWINLGGGGLAPAFPNSAIPAPLFTYGMDQKVCIDHWGVQAGLPRLPGSSRPRTGDAPSFR